MAGTREKSRPSQGRKSSPEAWRLKEGGKGTPKASPAGRKGTNPWLARPNRKRKEGGLESPSRKRTSGEHRLGQKLSRAEAKIEKQATEIAELREELKRLSQVGQGRSRRRKRKPKDPVSRLNRATFEELRSMGVPVTQAARVLANRELKEGFDEIDEIDEISGLSGTTRELLRESAG